MVAVRTSTLLTMVDARISIPELTDMWFWYFLAAKPHNDVDSDTKIAVGKASR